VRCRQHYCVTHILCDESGSQLGTLGAGNHYAEIQVVDEIYNEFSARKMGIEEVGQVCVMIHCGSRGLGHQVATGMYCFIITVFPSLSLSSVAIFV